MASIISSPSPKQPDKVPDVIREPGLKKEAGPMFVPYFLAEMLSVAALAALAYFMRRTNVFKSTSQWAFTDDPNYNVKPPESDPTHFVPESTFSFIVIFLPVGVVFVKEGFKWALSEEPTMTLLVCGCGINESFRRVVRFSGCYFMGLCLTSVCVDGIQLMTGRPNPSFVYSCFGGKPPTLNYLSIKDCTKPDANYLSDRSFPNSKSALAAYCFFFVGSYLKRLLEFRSVYTIKPYFLVGLMTLAVLPALGDYAATLCHLDAVIWGLVIGLGMGMFIVDHLQYFEERRKIEEHEQEFGALTGNYSRPIYNPLVNILPRIQAVNRSLRHYNHYSTAPAQSLPKQAGVQRSNTVAGPSAHSRVSTVSREGFYYSPRLDYFNSQAPISSSKPYMAY